VLWLQRRQTDSIAYDLLAAKAKGASIDKFFRRTFEVYTKRTQQDWQWQEKKALLGRVSSTLSTASCEQLVYNLGSSTVALMN
jgi:hypothetical protein